MRTAQRIMNVQRDRNHRSHRVLGISACVLFAVSPMSVIAQSGNGYDLTWSTIDGGGGLITGNGYELNGTIGQPDAGPLSGSGYELNGGFWLPAASGVPCAAVGECAADGPNNACNHAACASGFCSYICVKYGDVKAPPDGLVNLDDILCVLGGFSSFGSCVNGDIHPCGGNAIINLDDILGVLGAFAGANPCGCDPGAASPLCGSSSP